MYRRAAVDVAQDVAEGLASFGKRLYEDSILRAGNELRQLAERFLDDPIGTTLSVLDSFPATRREGEFLADFAAVFTILANAARGLAFENAVRVALNAAKNKIRIEVPGVGRSIPDVLDKLNHGLTEIKSGLEIDSSLQLRVQATWARITGIPFNLVISSTTKRVSKRVKKLVHDTGGIIQRFDLATGTFTPYE
jgi:hypothetical protein